jgi:hypothetical protein
VRPVVFREEEPPGDAAIVVRGGLLTPDSVQRTAERCRREYGFLGVSVYGAIGITVAELVSTVPQIGPERYRQIRVSTFGRVRGAGFPLWPTNRNPHFSLVLPDLDDVTLARLDACFGRPQASPALPGR